MYEAPKGTLQNSKPGKTWETIPTEGDDFYKEKGGLDLHKPSQPLTNSQPKGGGGGVWKVERLGWFPKFYPVLSSKVLI